ncbi:FliM/FliN family flagellar motor switch protein [Sphingorhabdus sp. EL138]|uniref:FliM/FliN family flagellar motor switch protein n=1 Tax=Sphingorhabdus sp. EL138 TaxID=2073156 RepID=UPI0025E806C7|nr:FliM/FliN family flagellar motor switch protein [Sphingorhabdus sp. EL138]
MEDDQDSTTEFELPQLPEISGQALEESDQFSATDAQLNLEPVHNVVVKIQAVLGKTKVNVGELMRMRSGDVIDLDRRAGEPIDVWVNNRLIARGEVVLTDGLLGVALTEMVRQVN